jgi:photosystem II stability/assembly factor-like uncharacterized protein
MNKCLGWGPTALLALGLGWGLASTPVAARAQGTPSETKAGEPKKEEARKDEPKKEEVKPDPERQKQISEIEKQLQELTRKLEELRKAEPSGSPEADKARQELVQLWLKKLTWRGVGPANMGGRIVALAVNESDPTNYFAATASAGLLKTTNNGTSFTHVFDDQATVSVGDVAIAASDPNIVWVGTGEANARNSVSYGDGVYKSTDAGKTWTNMGLKDSFQIGKVLIHPKDPNIVYVGALGRLYGPNPERGLFKTTDGGKTWNKVLFIDDVTGVIDARMHPTDPETLIVATYERKRGIYDEGDPIVRYGAGAGLHKTTDGGKTWTKLAKGLPNVKLGRIGLDWYRKDPNIVFAIIESEKIGTGKPLPAGAGTGYMGIQGEDRDNKAVLSEVIADGPSAKAGLLANDVVVAFDTKPVKSYEELIDAIRSKKADDKVKVKVDRAGKTVEVEVALGKRPEGGQGGGDPNRPYGAQLGGQRENVQDRQGDDGFQTGGVYKSTDAGASWTRINSLNPRPFYFSQVRVDPNDDKYLYVLGIALYRSSDGGKTFRGDGGRSVHADQHALWVDPRDGRHIIVACDGGLYATHDRMETWDHFNHMALSQFYDVATDATRDYRVFGGLQDNGTWGGPSRTHDGAGPINEDWLSISGGDGFQVQVDPEDRDLVYATSQYGALLRRNLKTGETARIRPSAEKDVKLVWNWNTPFILSPHNGRIYFCAANYVYRSLDRGGDLRRISPKITLTDAGSATALSQSPKNPDVLYVGTDDGALWVTKNGGGEWTDLTKKLGLEKPLTVATIEASRFAEGRVYVAFDAHRMDDDKPYLLVSEDFGATWKKLSDGLPRGSTHCLREDIENQNLLYAGTEFGVIVSLDRGAHWAPLKNNLPTVAVFDFVVHPTAGELVAATHGRGVWIVDVSGLRQVTDEVLKAPASLMKPITAIRWRSEPSRGRTNRRFVGQNPTNGAPITFSLTKEASTVSLKIVDVEGKTVRVLRSYREPGLHTSFWDLSRTIESTTRRPGGGTASTRGAADQAAAAAQAAAGASTSPGESAAAAIAAAITGRSSPFLPGRSVPPGLYRVVLTVDGKEFSQPIRVEADPVVPEASVGGELDGDEMDADIDADADMDAEAEGGTRIDF